MSVTYGADDLELLWTTLEVEADLPTLEHEPRTAALRGVANLWVVPRSRLPGVRALRLHCRQCDVLSVSINGAPTGWELLDPHERILHDESLRGDGEALEVFQHAAFMAAHDGELMVHLPEGHRQQPSLSDEPWAVEQPPAVAATAAAANAARAAAFRELQARLTPVPGAEAPLLVQVRFTLEDPRGGFKVIRKGRWGHALSQAAVARWGDVRAHPPTCLPPCFSPTAGVFSTPRAAPTQVPWVWTTMALGADGRASTGLAATIRRQWSSS